MAPRMVVPPGKTFFEELKVTYNDIQLKPDQKIPTGDFIDATENFIKLFRKLPICQFWCDSRADNTLDISEGLAFSVVEKDMTGNIAVSLNSTRISWFLVYELDRNSVKDS